jgi:hypothetical protein
VQTSRYCKSSRLGTFISSALIKYWDWENNIQIKKMPSQSRGRGGRLTDRSCNGILDLVTQSWAKVNAGSRTSWRRRRGDVVVETSSWRRRRAAGPIEPASGEGTKGNKRMPSVTGRAFPSISSGSITGGRLC